MTVEDAKCMQANAFIQAAVFQEYQCRKSSAIFRINLTILMVTLVLNVIIIILLVQKKRITIYLYS